MLKPFSRHCQMKGPVPETNATKVTGEPIGALVLSGWASITGGGRTRSASEKSEVLPEGSVAVAVTNWVTFAGTWNGIANPLSLTVTKADPINRWPWPKPEGPA